MNKAIKNVMDKITPPAKEIICDSPALVASKGEDMTTG